MFTSNVPRFAARLGNSARNASEDGAIEDAHAAITSDQPSLLPGPRAEPRSSGGHSEKAEDQAFVEPAH